MTTKHIPRLIQEGINNLVFQGTKDIAEGIIEEYAEKLKQDYKARMHERIKADVSTSVVSALDDDSIQITVNVNVTGVEHED